MPDNDRTPLQIALEQACQFAIAHGVEPPITPDDFGIQRSSAGWQHAVYVDRDHAISVTVHPNGPATFAVAELDWIHDQADEDRDICDYCGVIDPREFDDRPHYRGVPLVDVHLPGDAPAEVVIHG